MEIYLFKIPGIILAITIHEFVRAFVSTKFGDVLPKQEGRLTLNPIKHFEPIGFVLFIITGYGWSKPVNTRSIYYKNRKRYTTITNVLPLISNLVVGIICLICFGLLAKNPNMGILSALFKQAMVVNIGFAIFNLIPVPPLDGYKIIGTFLSPNHYIKMIQYEKIFQIILLLLLFANILTPILNIITNFLITIFAMMLGF